MNGIDISNWQNGINLAAVPFDFVICKATEGTRYVSPDCDRQIQQAIGLGKLVGVYHYVNGGDAEAEAEYFYEHCKGYVGKAAFFIDWEDQGNKAWGDTSYLKAMAERLAELLGVSVDRIGIYASKSVFPWNLTDAKTWVAQYADMNATGYQDAPWNEGAYDCAIRQYSSCGRLDGWAGNLDINKCYISRAEWEAMAGGSNGDPDSLIHGIDETPAADLAAKVLAGELGDGDDRKHALGDRYQEVQSLVDAGGVLSNHQIVVHIGADLLVVVQPLVGRTIEIIAVVLELEGGIVLLAELNGIAAGGVQTGVGQGAVADALLLGEGRGDVLSLGSTDLDGRAVDGEVAALVAVLDQRSLESVQAHLGTLLTGENGGAADAQAVEETDLIGDLGDVDLPVGAGEALDLGIIAERDEEHLGELEAGQLAGGSEGAVTVAGHNAGGGAVVNKAGGPAGSRDVGELGSTDESLGGLVAEQQVADDLGSLLTGEVVLGVEVALLIANENADGVHDFHSFIVVDLVGIFESCVADGDEGHGHDQRQHQSE